MTLIRIGNWLFRTRDFAFPLALVFALIPEPEIFVHSLWAVTAGFSVALLGQFVRTVTIGLEYIVRGGRNRRVYAEGLVTGGIYSHVRNPMYVGNLLIVAGVAIASNAWPCLLFSVGLFAFVYSAIIAAEEDYLRRKFGAAHESYCRDVPRWLPRLRGLGSTLAGMKFHWRRVVLREYGTPFAWIIFIAIVAVMDVWPVDEQLDLVVLRLIASGLVIGAILWAIARILKKNDILIGD